MIPYAQARALLLAHAIELPSRRVSLAEAIGRTAAENVSAPFDVPSFDNSAMDGFAVRAADCAIEAGKTEARLPVGGVVAAGAPKAPWRAGQAIQIMTGAALSEGPDAVVPIENVAVERDRAGAPVFVTFHEPVAPGANIRRRGQDFQAGDPLVHKGEWITPRHVMALAALGFGGVTVKEPPRVAILATGDEIRALDASSDGLPPGSSAIFDSNTPYLLSVARQYGLEAMDGGRTPDTKEAFVQVLRRLIDDPSGPRMAISTGAVSKGDFDFIPAALAEVGAQIVFHRVAIRPGKPVLFAILPGGIPFFGLPGNPISCAVGFRFFAIPLLRASLGLPEERPWRLPLLRDHQCPRGLKFFLKAALEFDERGAPAAVVLPGQESFRIKPMLQASGWIASDEASPRMEAGQMVDFYPALPQTAMRDLQWT
jgi:molybdopterin molybdotransferase